jgi:EAL domain-containing protein (putative c-di-GMP-specific phosphodiesterase class I)
MAITPLKSDRLKHHEIVHRLKFEEVIADEPDKARILREEAEAELAELQARISPLQAEINQLGRQFWVDKKQIVSNKYDLSASRYRAVEQEDAFLERRLTLGVHLAIDDFGTGYSSLAYLKRLPLDVLKIDRSFVTGIGLDREDRAIVKAIISLAKSLNLSITAEGIETEDQSSLLRDWACEQGQGYYFARPLNSADFATLLQHSGGLPAVQTKAA